MPLIRRALGNQWEKLHPAVRRHYSLGAEYPSQLRLTGTMHEVDHAAVIKPFIWAARLFGALVPYRGRNLPVEVLNRATENGDTLFWQRRFHFPGKKPYRFISRMEMLKDNEIIEYVRFRLGICMAVSEQDGALCYRSRGYLWRLGFLKLRIPDRLLLGEAIILERGMDDNSVELDFVIRHPLFGNTFSYSGSFTLYET